jgi:hypothetical protein
MLRHYDDLGLLHLDGGSRELYHDYSPDDPATGITELQIPVTR